MGLKNKSEHKDQRIAGKVTINGYFYSDTQMNPEKFANSSNLRKIKNRNKKK